MTYEVSILGAVNAQDRQQELRQARLRDLYYELSIYYGEGNVAVEGDDKATMIGLFLVSYMRTELDLPPSLRRSVEDINTDVWDKLLLSRRTWSDDLEARCQEFDLPFFYTPLGKSRKFAFPLKDIGFGWRNGRLEPVRPDVIRKRNRMLNALNQ